MSGSRGGDLRRMSGFSTVNQIQEKVPINLTIIEEKRKQLLQTARMYGMYAAETLQCSRELDVMIVEFQEKCLPV